MNALTLVGGCFLFLTRTAFAGAGNEVLTPGWDAFPALTSGSVTWSIAPGSSTFSATYDLVGAAPNQDHMVGMHHFDARSRILFGGGTTSTGSWPSEITRESNTSAVTDTTFGFVPVDGSGNASSNFTFNNVNPGLYNVQFHVRAGGAPGCPATSCNAIYRTGDTFADQLVRFSSPGALAFWSGDDHLADEVGANDLATVGTVSFRAAHFRGGFDLAGSGNLQLADPAAVGLAPTNAFTVAMWVTQDVFSSTASVFNLRTAANSSGFTLEPAFNSPGNFLFAVNTTGMVEGFATLVPGGFPFGSEFFIAATFDAATHTMRVYRDDVLVAERNDVPGGDMVLQGGENLVIGRNVVSNANFDGAIDDVLFFDRALTLSELRGILAAGIFADGFEQEGE